jgi:hypothetical protein
MSQRSSRCFLEEVEEGTTRHERHGGENIFGRKITQQTQEEVLRPED